MRSRRHPGRSAGVHRAASARIDGEATAGGLVDPGTAAGVTGLDEAQRWILEARHAFRSTCIPEEPN
jgi:hypothetical protein